MGGWVALGWPGGGAEGGRDARTNARGGQSERGTPLRRAWYEVFLREGVVFYTTTIYIQGRGPRRVCYSKLGVTHVRLPLLMCVFPRGCSALYLRVRQSYISSVSRRKAPRCRARVVLMISAGEQEGILYSRHRFNVGMIFFCFFNFFFICTPY